MYNMLKVKNLIQIFLVISLLFPITAFAAAPLKLTAIGDKAVDEGVLLSFTISATGGTTPYTYSFSASPSLPLATIDSSTGYFSWTPGYDQAGNHSVTFIVTDNTSAQKSEDITITVNDVNHAPVLDLIDNKTVDEGQVLKFTISASDPDTDNTLTYSASGLPSGANFNAATKTFTWSPTYTQAGPYPNVRFTVTDNGSPNMNDYEDITITVNDEICNSPDLPAIDFTGIWAFSPTTKTLTLSNMLVTVSAISPTEFYIENDPVKEEIIDAAVNVPSLNRDLVNPYFFGDSTLSIVESTNTYLSSNLTSIQFIPVYGGGQVVRLVMNECYDSDNLRSVNTDLNINASRFIETLIPVGYGPDYPNLRLTLNVEDGIADFDTFESSGSCAGKIESALGPTLIDLALFEVTPVNREVVVIWVTASEIDNVGFNVYRSESEVGGYVQLNPSIILAEGDSTQGEIYEYVDEDVKNRKTYYYMLEDIDLYGTSTFHGPISATPRLIFGGINR